MPGILRPWPLWVLLSMGLISGACTTADDDDDDDAVSDDDTSLADDDVADDDTDDDDDTAPPFTCDVVQTSSPQLAAEMYFDPADPHPGDTLTVIVSSTNGTAPGDAPSMTMRAEGAGGVTLEQASYVAGGGETRYNYDVDDLPIGDICLLGCPVGPSRVILGA